MRLLLGIAIVGVAACLPSYTLVEGGGSGGEAGTSSSSAGSGGATTSSSTSGTGAGGCAGTSCDPQNCGVEGHDCLGGLCLGGMCQPVEIAGGQRGGGGIVVTADRVYWSEWSRFVISSCPVAGCGPEGMLRDDIAMGQINPTQVALSATHVYWTDFGAGGALRRCDLPLCIGGVETLSDGPTPPTSLALAGTDVYLGLGFGGVDGAVLRCPLDGCGAAGANAFTYASQLAGAVSGVAVSKDGVFWIDINEHAFQCPLTGCTGAPQQIVQGSAESIAIDDTSLYFGAGDAVGGVFKCPLAGCGANDADKVLVAPTTIRATTLIVDGPNLYWLEQGPTGAAEGLVKRVGKSGGVVTTLAAGQRFPVALAVDATSVWWLNRGLGIAPGDQIDGSVMRLAK